MPHLQFCCSSLVETILSLQISSMYFLHFSIFISLWLPNSNISPSSPSSLTQYNGGSLMPGSHMPQSTASLQEIVQYLLFPRIAQCTLHLSSLISPSPIEFQRLARHLNSSTEPKLLLYIFSSCILLLIVPVYLFIGPFPQEAKTSANYWRLLFLVIRP